MASNNQQITIDEFRRLQARQKLGTKIRAFFLFGTLFLMLSCMGYILITQPAPAASNGPRSVSVLTGTNQPEKETPAPWESQSGMGGGDNPTITPTVPDYQGTQTALQETQRALDNAQATVTAKAEAWTIEGTSAVVQAAIDDIQHRQQMKEQEREEEADHQKALNDIEENYRQQSLNNQATQEAWNLAEEIKKGEERAARNKLFFDGLYILFYGALFALVISLTIAGVLFIFWILRRAHENIKYDSVIRQNEEDVENAQEERARKLSDKAMRITKERELILELCEACIAIKKGDDHQIPRFDKIKEGISQKRRDEAIAVLVRYNRCTEVEHGKATYLKGGTFEDLKDDILEGLFPPTRENLTAFQNITPNSTQNQTVLNSSNTPRVRRIGEGAYIQEG